MLNIYDKNGKRFGYIKQGQISFCFNDGGKQLCQIAQCGGTLGWNWRSQRESNPQFSLRSNRKSLK